MCLFIPAQSITAGWSNRKDPTGSKFWGSGTAATPCAGAPFSYRRRANEQSRQHALPELHIRGLAEVQKEVEIRLSLNSHGVRLDIQARDDQDRILDVEMQLQDERNIPKHLTLSGKDSIVIHLLQNVQNARIWI